MFADLRHQRDQLHYDNITKSPKIYMHPNSLQDYIIEKTNISGKMVKAQVQSGATAQEAMQPSRAETV